MEEVQEDKEDCSPLDALLLESEPTSEEVEEFLANGEVSAV